LRDFSAKGFCNLIPRIERLLEGEMQFDRPLDLVKRETEFATDYMAPAPRVR
jgi:hypothetical protein